MTKASLAGPDGKPLTRMPTELQRPIQDNPTFPEGEEVVGADASSFPQRG